MLSKLEIEQFNHFIERVKNSNDDMEKEVNMMKAVLKELKRGEQLRHETIHLMNGIGGLMPEHPELQEYIKTATERFK